MDNKKDMLQSVIEEYVKAHHQETIALVKKLAVIPAPSGQEEKRAAFILDWLHSIGARNAFIDAAGNVIYPYQCETDGDMIVIMAHMDVVCPDTDMLSLQEVDGRLIGPGVRDDTANLVNMLMTIKFLLADSIKLKTGILFVADVGEEGLGNLKGSRQIYETYGSRITRWLAFDLNYDCLYVRAVGSRRYKITIRTKGGHSYSDFGEKNAIAQLAEVIVDLYHIKNPEFARDSETLSYNKAEGSVSVNAEGREVEESSHENVKCRKSGESIHENVGCQETEKQNVKVTYNVGKIEGGTTVNTIAQEASVLYEIRSESENAMKTMEQILDGILEKHRASDVNITKEVIGIRPGNGTVDVEEQRKLEERCWAAIEKYYDGEVVSKAGSTDCNIPLSKGIPAITVGTAMGERTHTREEWLAIDSMKLGQKIALEIVLGEGNER